MKDKYKSLYEITGRIEDVATFLVPISDLPPQRTWVGLTDEEIEKVWRSVDYTKPWDVHRIDVAHAIETKLKEKNT